METDENVNFQKCKRLGKLRKKFKEDENEPSSPNHNAKYNTVSRHKMEKSSKGLEFKYILMGL